MDDVAQLDCQAENAIMKHLLHGMGFDVDKLIHCMASDLDEFWKVQMLKFIEVRIDAKHASQAGFGDNAILSLECFLDTLKQGQPAPALAA
ncbi:hypothetical protein ACPRNU_22605 [Chromobacterium vaccinii]|uniref:hypothetical protein n=1 Tax=Chromobacterium vaccinii TaxID=1108595 RepID=UPI003C70A921